MALENWSANKKIIIISSALFSLFHFVYIFIPLLRAVTGNIQLGESGLIILLIDLPLTIIAEWIIDLPDVSYNFLFWYYGILGTFLFALYGALIGKLISFIYQKIKFR